MSKLAIVSRVNCSGLSGTTLFESPGQGHVLLLAMIRCCLKESDSITFTGFCNIGTSRRHERYWEKAC